MRRRKVLSAKPSKMAQRLVSKTPQYRLVFLHNGQIVSAVCVMGQPP
ncbi:hypothetical protein [uncultured Mediterranean phage]|nr:hypothetical protein [uncultured Mediterranean phage]